MTTVAVHVEMDHLERLARVRPLGAVAEMVWNALDADATSVAVHIRRDALGAIEEVVVEDDGIGMTRAEALDVFGRLGGSWKKTPPRRSRVAGRALHGQEGQGRFRAFALGDIVVWNSVAQVGDVREMTTIRGTRNSLGTFEICEAEETVDDGPGTKVRITVTGQKLDALLHESVVDDLAVLFALYMQTYEVAITYDGFRIDPSKAQSHVQEYEIDEVPGASPQGNLVVIEWYPEVERKLMLCNHDGVVRGDIPPGVQAPKFNFTAYLRSPLFDELDAYDFDTIEMDQRAAPLIDAAKDKLREHFKRRADDRSRELVARWKAEDVYPYRDEPTTKVEQAEREVFNVVALQVNSALPTFGDLDRKNRKLALRLLREGIETNPNALRRILGDVLDLPAEKQNELAELLERTTLSSIISIGKLVTDRLDFLAGLEVLLFDPENKKALKERSQLHRILAAET